MGKSDKRQPRESTKRVRTRGKSSPKKAASPAAASAASNTLKKSFENLKEKEKKAEEGDVTKGMQSGFITYVKWCCSSKDTTAATQAAAVLTKYQKMNATEKKGLIQSFYSNGAKKQGLTTIFQQSLSVEEQIGGGSWSGYVTPAKLFTLHGVPGILVKGSCVGTYI